MKVWRIVFVTELQIFAKWKEDEGFKSVLNPLVAPGNTADFSLI